MQIDRGHHSSMFPITPVEESTERVDFFLSLPRPLRQAQWTPEAERILQEVCAVHPYCLARKCEDLAEKAERCRLQNDLQGEGPDGSQFSDHL
jgi:hypothetical protein